MQAVGTKVIENATSVTFTVEKKALVFESQAPKTMLRDVLSLNLLLCPY